MYIFIERKRKKENLKIVVLMIKRVVNILEKPIEAEHFSLSVTRSQQ